MSPKSGCLSPTLSLSGARKQVRKRALDQDRQLGAKMRKSRELTDPNSCMSRARADEMTFVLLARDVTAPATIRFWVSERIRLGKNKQSDPQIVEALQCAEAMEEQLAGVVQPIRGSVVYEDGEGNAHGSADTFFDYMKSRYS